MTNTNTRFATRKDHGAYVSTLATRVYEMTQKYQAARMLGIQQGQPRGIWLVTFRSAEDAELHLTGKPYDYTYTIVTDKARAFVRDKAGPEQAQLMDTFDMTKGIGVMVAIDDKFWDGTTTSVIAVNVLTPSLGSSASGKATRPPGKDTAGACSNPECKDKDPTRKMLRCGGCRYTAYCSKTCQKSHWKAHKQTCVAVDKRNEIVDKARKEHGPAIGLVQYNDGSANLSGIIFTTSTEASGIVSKCSPTTAPEPSVPVATPAALPKTKSRIRKKHKAKIRDKIQNTASVTNKDPKSEPI